MATVDDRVKAAARRWGAKRGFAWHDDGWIRDEAGRFRYLTWAEFAGDWRGHILNDPDLKLTPEVRAWLCR
jgi:hypothetical protein